MGQQYIISPSFQGDVEVGPEGLKNRIFMGRLAETGSGRRVDFNAGREFVVLIVGKRGSGKSYTMGSLLEGFCTKGSSTSLSQLSARPGILLLDPMMNFWTTTIPVVADGPEKVKKQFELLDGWKCGPEDSEITVWMPAGFTREGDFPGIQPFSLRASDLDSQDWADLVGTNLMRDPQGMLLGDALEAVSQIGWEDQHGRRIKPKKDYGISDVINYLETNPDAVHRVDTVRALLRTLKAWERQGVFQPPGTSLVELIRPGALSILMLPQRIGHDLRRIIARVLIRRLLKEREVASQVAQRLDVTKLEAAERSKLEDLRAQLVPKTVLAIDEAQELLGEEGGEARVALEDFCLLGRNYGLSLILATQRPTAGAISTKVRAQVDTYFIHRLLTDDDIDTARRNLISEYPEEVRLGHVKCDFTRLVRTLPTGHCFVTSDRIHSKDGLRRAFILEVRPRTRVHGGEVS